MKKRNFTIVRTLTLLIALFLAVLPVLAGSLDSPAAPADAGSAMYTLEDIYNRLNAGTAGAKRSGAFTEPAAGPASTGYTLDDVMGKAPTVDDTDGLTPSETTSGKTFWGLNSGTWGLQTGSNANVVDTSTGDAVAGEILSGKIAYVDGSGLTGTMPNNGTVNITPGTSSQTIAAGYHNGSGSVDGDAALLSTNIKSGVTIFSVAGDSNVVDTSSGDAVATEIANGKIAYVNGSAVTGSLYAGVTCTGTLNGTRWCDNGDGTVTDLNTGLVWLQEADWGGQVAFWVNPQGGTNAHDKTASLTAAGNAALSDSSVEGDWRLPTLKELKALTASGTEDVFSNIIRAFTGVQANLYWSSTTYSANTDNAWHVYLDDGSVENYSKSNTGYVWPVRGP